MEKAKIPEKYLNEDVQGLIKEKLEGLKNDPEVYALIQKLGLSSREVKRYLALLLNYQEDRNYCKNCPGLSGCAKYSAGFQISLSYEDGVVERHQSPCPLQIKKNTEEAAFLRRDFKDSWLGLILNDPKVDKTKAREDAIREMVLVASGKSKRWIYLKGVDRSGKSFLLAALCNSFVAIKKTPVAFVSCPDLVNELREMSIKDKPGFDEKMAEFTTCPVLVLDDFGNEYKSEFAFSTVLLPLLKERLKNGLLTFFGSEFNFEEIASMYEPKIGSLMAKQLSNFLKGVSKAPYELTGAKIY